MSCVFFFFSPLIGLFGWLFLSGEFLIHCDFLLFSHFSGSRCVEVHLWTCGDSGWGRGRGVLGAVAWGLDSPDLCFMGAGLVWSDPCTGVLLSGVLCWYPALTFVSWLFAYGVKVPTRGSLLVLTPGLCLVSGSLSISEYHHQGMKKYIDPQLTQYQLWKDRTSTPGLPN